MISRRQFLAILGSGAVLTGGAALGLRLLPDSDATGLYPAIRYGRESCYFCGLTIADARFAAAWRARGVERHFDDIGCMVNALHRDRPGDEARFFVHDYRDESWLDGSTATYVLSSTIKTPMGYEVAAVANAGSADDLGLQVAMPLPWSQVLTRLERRS